MKQPDINDINSPAPEPATKEDLDKFTKDSHRILIGVIVVLFVGFVSIILVGIGFVIDYYVFKAATYQDLVNQVNSQSNQITNLSTQQTDLSNYIHSRLK